MPIHIPPQANELLTAQGKAIASRQGAIADVDPRVMRGRVSSGRWQRLQRGVYAAFSGDPARETLLWAALLRAGPDAVLSHQTAAERHGLIDTPSPVIIITVPAPGAGEDTRHDRPPVRCDPADQASGHAPAVHASGGHSTAAHPEDEQWRDKRRDNANLVGGIVTLRFGFPELGDHRCESAAYVAAVLRSRGWPGTPHPCRRPSCALRDAAS